MTDLYAGPVIDPHHHLWDLSLKRHPWLTDSRPVGEDDMVFGSINAIRRDYGVAEYLADAEGQNIVATVHIEAGWAEDHLAEESPWLAALDRKSGVARRHVARVPLCDPESARLLEREAADRNCVGIRDIVAWHPDPAKSFTHQSDLMDDPAWRAGLKELTRLGLVFDLMLYPWQMADAARLVANFPGTLFAVNHCGSPADRSAEGMALWRAGLAELGRADNVAIKISDPVAYDNDWTLDSLRPVVEHCITCFGSRRAMFGSDFPVTGLHATFAEIYDAFRRIVGAMSREEQHDLFFATANRIYRVGLTDDGTPQEKRAHGAA